MPPSVTVPAAGRHRPDSTLKQVDLPAPLGPMSACTEPGVTVKETPSRAVSPAKRTVTSRTSSTGGGAVVVRSVTPPLVLGRLAQIEAAYGVGAGEFTGGAFEAGLADLEDMGVVGEGERHAGVLLDEEDGGALGIDLADHLGDTVHHLRGEAQGGLVEEQQARGGHQGAADGEHLLLAAGEQARCLVGAFGEAREEGEDAVAGLPDLGGTGAAAEAEAAGAEVLVDGEAGEHASSLGYLDDSGADRGDRVPAV
ncbi:hypothetical protein SHKM778_52260 [Streptomyces sp. KM77-8]|uniref:Uncharacterized protein n=1 Tax=Streptomyces haneummycinicus TaxID=3074435 RepID=A0AAT9HN54_9ACTN